MSNSLIKSYNVNYADRNEKKNKRIIDSNEAISERIKELSEKIEQADEEEFAQDFSEGLDAEQVDALLSDPDDIPPEIAAKNEAAEKMLAEAQEEADRIIADANAEADRIIAEANEQAGGVLEEARARGAEEGNQKGYEEGLERAKQLEEEAEQKAVALEEEYETRKEELEPQLVEKLTEIYSHVFGIDLSGRNDVVLYLLKNTISNIDTAKSYLVHVSKSDHETVSANKDMLEAGLGSSVSVEIIEDVTLTEGNCYIETDGGIFDCSIGTELELLAKELKILSYSS